MYVVAAHAEAAGGWGELHRLLLTLSFLMFVLVLGGMIVFTVRYPGGARLRPRSGHALEMIWRVVPMILVLSVFGWGLIVADRGGRDAGLLEARAAASQDGPLIRKPHGGEGEKSVKSVSVAVVMKNMAEEPPRLREAQNPSMQGDLLARPGAKLYAKSCLGCHGSDARGGIKVGNLGVYPPAYVVTAPLQGEALEPSRFSGVVLQGIPGALMPARGNLSASELRDLLAFVRGVSGR